jgi:hypothetical protein
MIAITIKNKKYEKRKSWLKLKKKESYSKETSE